MVGISCYDYDHVCGHMYVCMYVCITYVRTYVRTYVDARTVSGRVYGNSDDLMLRLICNSVRVSGLNLLLLADVMEAISRQFRVYLSRKLLYADDLVVIAYSKEEVSVNFYVWMKSLENNIMSCHKMP